MIQRLPAPSFILTAAADDGHDGGLIPIAQCSRSRVAEQTVVASERLLCKASPALIAVPHFFLSFPFLPFLSLAHFSVPTSVVSVCTRSLVSDGVSVCECCATVTVSRSSAAGIQGLTE